MSPAASTDKRGISQPRLQRADRSGVTVLTDQGLMSSSGILVAFTERTGGVSESPFDSLNLAAHVGDDPDRVDENRAILMHALGMDELRSRIVSAEQVHGVETACVDASHVGSGAFAGGALPVAGTDALVTGAVGVPLLMLYADCVPVVLVAREPRPTIAVVHSGWRGTLDGVVRGAIEEVARLSGTSPEAIYGYVGPHIGPCCYQVDDTLISQFRNRFDTITAVDGRLDLEAAVIESMELSGMRRANIAPAGLCTRDLTDRFFSYRAHRITGRHGALAVITKAE